MTVKQAIRSSLGLLTKRDRRLLGISMAIQMATSLLDLVGVLLIGLVAALSVTTVQSQPPPSTVEQVADFFGLGELSDQALVGVFAGAAAIVLLTKSVFSSYLTRRVFKFLANRQALVSARLTRALLARPLTFIQNRSSQQIAYSLIAGAGAATSSILGQLVVSATETALLAVLGVALLLVNPVVAIGAILFFALVALGLQKAMGNWAARVGRLAARADIESWNAVQEAISAYREVTVSNRRQFYVDRIQALRWQAASVTADSQFIGMFPKYMFEAALVIGGFALAGVLFATQDSVQAVGSLALFLAAGTRVMPSLLRLQSATLQLRGSAGSAGPTFELAADLDHPLDAPAAVPLPDEIRDRIRQGNPDFIPSVVLENVSVSYPGTSQPALIDVSLSIKPGQSVALVGRSGAGKSTLADIMLGVLSPGKGTASVGGLPPLEATVRWPGGVAYVPQDVMLANATIRSNVALGLPPDAIDDELVWHALDRAHLADYLRSTREGLDTEVGEAGVRLSGGQRQRLGIARALYTQPRLLILDEATSALDAETEEAISQMISELDGDVTTVVVAHRLSTVRGADFLVYMDSGSVVRTGTFDDIVDHVPSFARQSALMGIADLRSRTEPLD